MRNLLLSLCVLLLLNSVGCARAVNASVQSGVVLIDPGHGGFDGGAVAADGTTEKHLNLAISLHLRDLLTVCGATVEMTRTTDVGLDEDMANSIREKKVGDLRRRLSLYNEASLVISIHQNHFDQTQYSGTQVFYSPNHPDSAVVAHGMQGTVTALIQPQNRRECKAATDGIYLLYHTKTPAVLVECGFLSNPEEREKLKTPVYQQQMAFALMASVWNNSSKQ